jgi:hypothetical protein
MELFALNQWSPYLVGVLIGLLNLGALIISKKPLGASTGFLKVGGLVYKIFDKNKIDDNEYYQKKKPEVDWGVMLIIGIVFGSLVSSLLSGDFAFIAIPDMWESSMPGGFGLRFVGAVFGGILLGIGARWAGGCTSGHGISGTSLLSPISWIASICFFIGGIATAYLIYGI